MKKNVRSFFDWIISIGEAILVGILLLVYCLFILFKTKPDDRQIFQKIKKNWQAKLLKLSLVLGASLIVIFALSFKLPSGFWQIICRWPALTAGTALILIVFGDWLGKKIEKIEQEILEVFQE